MYSRVHASLSYALARQEDTRFVPRVALEELNPDLEFEVMGEDDYGASIGSRFGLVCMFLGSHLLLRAQPCRTTTTTMMTTIKHR